jgi:hypothetical protein
MKSRNPISSGESNTRKRLENEADRRAQLASYAIDRGHAHTLRRHLLQGLNPHAFYYHRGFSSSTLIDRAAWHGALECLRALEEAGARVSEEGILNTIILEENHHIVAYLLETEKFDPSGLMESGRPWAEAIRLPTPGAASSYVRAISEWERSKITSEALNFSQKSRPKFL